MPGISRPLVAFYPHVLGRVKRHASAVYDVLGSPRLQLVVHAIPESVAVTIRVAVPPVRRDDAAIKFCHAVPSIERVRIEAAGRGGEVVRDLWSGPGFIVCNARDPEGNVFQVRKRTA